MVMEELTLGGEDTMHYINDALESCTLKTR